MKRQVGKDGARTPRRRKRQRVATGLEPQTAGQPDPQHSTTLVHRVAFTQAERFENGRPGGSPP
jgi:hypothetical protein